MTEPTIHGSYQTQNGNWANLARNPPICISNTLQVTSQQSFYVFNSSPPRVKLMAEESKQMKGSSCFLFVLFRLWASPWMYVLCMVFAVQNENVVKRALCVETNLQVETYQNKPFILPSSLTSIPLSKQPFQKAIFCIFSQWGSRPSSTGRSLLVLTSDQRKRWITTIWVGCF